MGKPSIWGNLGFAASLLPLLLRPSDEAASSPGHLSRKMLVMGIHRQDENPQYEGLEKQTQKIINQASSSIRISLAV
jgi:hypothetical protein